MKAVKSAADTLRPNPKFKTDQVIMELGVGEALVSLLDEKGRPCMVERAFIVPPGSQLGPLDAAERKKAIESATIYGHYEKVVDRESAYEKLKGRTTDRQGAAAPAGQPSAQGGTPDAQPPAGGGFGGSMGGVLSDVLFGRTGPRGGKQSRGLVEAVATSAARTIGSELGRQVLRGVLGSILGGSKRR